MVVANSLAGKSCDESMLESESAKLCVILWETTYAILGATRMLLEVLYNIPILIRMLQYRGRRAGASNQGLTRGTWDPMLSCKTRQVLTP